MAHRVAQLQLRRHRRCHAGSEEERWLRADLAANSRRCTAAYWHHPLFTSSVHPPAWEVQPLFQALYDAGAEIVMNGHNHVYERFAPQDPSGNRDDEHGVREFDVGTGGAPLYEFERFAATASFGTTQPRGTEADPGTGRIRLAVPRDRGDFTDSAAAAVTDGRSRSSRGSATPGPRDAHPRPSYPGRMSAPEPLLLLYRGSLASCDHHCPYCPLQHRRTPRPPIAGRGELDRFWTG